ncbi:hypothetical protein FQN54_002959 [Arachnomyces sp. PD_36]|nr:hypothetical protein FQN54_002959 [Arachnomyces sp. PD_36]
MANLIWEVKKLPKDSGLLLLRPDAFLKHPSLQKSLHGRDTLLRLSPDMDKLFLDPKPKDSDQSMAEYCKRNETLLPEDRQKVHVGTNFESTLEKFLSKLGKIDESEQKLLDRVEAALAEIQELKEELGDVRRNLAVSQQSQFKLYSANLLMKMVDEIYSRKSQRFPSPSDGYRRYTMASELIGRDDFEGCHGIHLKYHDELRRLPKVCPTLKIIGHYSTRLANFNQRIAERNAAAHDTEYEFAELLLSTRNKDPGRYEFWSGLYPFCFGKTVEEIAAQGNEADH